MLVMKGVESFLIKLTDPFIKKAYLNSNKQKCFCTQKNIVLTATYFLSAVYI